MDTTLTLRERAAGAPLTPFRILNVFQLPPPTIRVKDSPAAGAGLFCSPAFPDPIPDHAHLGIDVLELPPHGSFPLHVHPGHHLLLTIGGEGSVTVAGVVHTTRVGDLYLIDALTPHAVGAGSAGHRLLAIGAPHKEVDAADRMTLLPADPAPAA